MNRIPPAVVSSVAATLLLSVAHQGMAEWGGVGGYANPADGQTLNPTTSDTDGDGIPDAWENANLLKADNPADALSDFDMDGLTALQEYQLQQTTSGAFGKHLGKWTTQILPAPTGFTSSNPSVNLIECAANGMILANVQGVLTGSSGTRTYPYIFNPETGVWTRVTAPDGVPSTITVTALDVNSSGAVVGYYSYQGQKGFVGMFGSSGWSSTIYQLDSGSGPVNAMPLRIGDSGHVVGNVGSRRFAARPDSTEVVFPGSWSSPMFLDVNEYGEFIGSITDPLTGISQTFLATEGHPVFLTGVRSNAVGAFAPGGPWSSIPDLDLDSTTWNEDPTSNSYYLFGEAQDRQTEDWYEVIMAWDGQIYWKPVTQFGSSGANWYTYPSFTQVPASVNNWGEFAGNYSGVTNGYYFDENWYETWIDGISDTGRFFFDGDYHITKERPSIYGVSNDPRVLLGTPFAVWSGSLTIPISNLVPPGTPTSYISARIADSGRVVFKAGASLNILKPNQDADGDGMPDDWEVFHGLNPASPADRNTDPDADGITNLTEFRYRTDPSLVTVLGSTGCWIHLRPGIDSDGDGLPDVWEWKHGLDYNNTSDAHLDADGDGLMASQEFLLGCDPELGDSDGDGLSDGEEIAHGSDPLGDADSADANGNGCPTARSGIQTRMVCLTGWMPRNGRNRSHGCGTAPCGSLGSTCSRRPTGRKRRCR